MEFFSSGLYVVQSKMVLSPFSRQVPKLVSYLALFLGLTNARQSKGYNMKERENKSRKEALAWLPRYSRTGEVDAVALVIRTGGALVPQERLEKQQSWPWMTKKIVSKEKWMWVNQKWG